MVELRVVPELRDTARIRLVRKNCLLRERQKQVKTALRSSTVKSLTLVTHLCASLTVQLEVECAVFVEGINPAPHIHEQMATANYVQMATTLRTPLRITTSRLSTMR